MQKQKLQEKVKDYYDKAIQKHGKCHQGVDWNSVESQYLRFEQLLKVVEPQQDFSINDLGCGYGALLEYLELKKFAVSNYAGYDLSEQMVELAQKQFASISNAVFYVGDNLREADYTVASGIFNVKGEASDDVWSEFMIGTLAEMNAASNKGFSFNVLTKYSDREYMKDYLYYADPAFLFDWCKRHCSRNVALLHDYDLYEFTILVKKNANN